MFEKAKLPKTAAGWVALAVFVALAALGTWQVSQGNWIATAIAALGAVGTAVNAGVWPPTKAAGALLLVGLLTGGAACSANLAVGYRTVLIVRDAGNAIDKTLANACKLNRLDCRAKHEDLSSEAGKVCLKTCHEALRQWDKHVKPAVNTALAVTYASLETAYLSGKNKTDWLKLILPGACALTQAAEQWEPIAPGKFKVVLAQVASMKGLVCK